MYALTLRLTPAASAACLSAAMCVILARPRRPNGSVTGTAWTTVSSALCSRLRASARANAAPAAWKNQPHRECEKVESRLCSVLMKDGGRGRPEASDQRQRLLSFCLAAPISSKAERRLGPLR